MKKLIMYHCSYCGKLICMKDVPKYIPVCCDTEMILRNDSRWDDMLLKKSAPKAEAANAKENRAEDAEKARERKVSIQDIEALSSCMKILEKTGLIGSGRDSEQENLSFREAAAIIRLAVLIAYANSLAGKQKE